MTRYLLLISFFLFLSASSYAGNHYFVSTAGNDSAAGDESNPWLTINHAVAQLNPGDILYIREGVYRENYIGSFKANRYTENDRIIVRNYPGESVIVNGGIDASGEANWEAAGDNQNVYYYKDALNTTYKNVSIGGRPLRLMMAYNDYTSGEASYLTGENQWARAKGLTEVIGDERVWVWAPQNENPGQYSIEISFAGSVFRFLRGADYITVEGITVENAYYPIQVWSDHVHLKNLTIRNAYGDAIKVEGWNGSGGRWDSLNGLVENCDIYNFGESGIDITGGDLWTVRKNDIHDTVAVRKIPGSASQPNGYYTNGIMIKNNNVGVLIEENTFRDMFSIFGVVNLGGNSYYNDVPVATNAVVRGNLFEDIEAPTVIRFQGAVGSLVEKNIFRHIDVINSNVSGAAKAIFQFREGVCDHHNCTNQPGEKVYFNSQNNTIVNNQFDNVLAQYAYRELQIYGQDNDIGNVINYNQFQKIIPSYFDDLVFASDELAESKGYDRAQFLTPGDSGWSDTGAGNAFYVDNSLFSQYFIVDDVSTFGTASVQTNIHSHFDDANLLPPNFELRGRFRFSDLDGGIGVTFFSQYPDHEDAYYRIRRYKNRPEFHLANHPHPSIVNGDLDSGVTPEANRWYRYRVLVDAGSQFTTIKAKIWDESDKEPLEWQIDAQDERPQRLNSGTVGVWSMGEGEKYWDDISVNPLN